MALQSSGEIRMSQINAELSRSSSAQVSLDTAENGGYAAINNCSTFRPSSTNPASMSEWYGYNHSQTCTLCNTDVSISAVTTVVGFSLYSYSHSLYFNMTSTGNVQPVFAIDSTNRNLEVIIYFWDAATNDYIGELYYNNIGVGTYTGERFGNKSTGNIRADISITSGIAAATFTYRLKINCPITLTCGNTGNGVGSYCGCGDDGLGTLYYWLDLGTTSRTVTVTYTTTNVGGGTQTIAVNYAGTYLTISGSTGFGTNQSFSFTYNYNGSSSLVRLEISNTCWC